MVQPAVEDGAGGSTAIELVVLIDWSLGQW